MIKIRVNRVFLRESISRIASEVSLPEELELLRHVAQAWLEQLGRAVELDADIALRLSDLVESVVGSSPVPRRDPGTDMALAMSDEIGFAIGKGAAACVSCREITSQTHAAKNWQRENRGYRCRRFRCTESKGAIR